MSCLSDCNTLPSVRTFALMWIQADERRKGVECRMSTVLIAIASFLFFLSSSSSLTLFPFLSFAFSLWSFFFSFAASFIFFAHSFFFSYVKKRNQRRKGRTLLAEQTSITFRLAHTDGHRFVCFGRFCCIATDSLFHSLCVCVLERVCLVT